MATYLFRSLDGDVLSSHPRLAVPVPLHALRASSVAAVEAHRALASAEWMERALARLVREPLGGDAEGEAVEPYEGDVVTANARKLHAVAVAAGFTAQVLELADRCVVEGYRQRPRFVAFRASWVRGSAGRGTWHEPWRFEEVDDPRTVKVSESSRLARAKHRAAGVPPRHMRQTASPWGVEVGVSQVMARVASYAPRRAADGVTS